MNRLQQFIKRINDANCGFLMDTDIPELIAIDRLCQVLVRCGGCRFVCSAQDVAHLEKCVVAGGDYVRDVSFPVGAFERAANWVHENCPVTPVSTLPASFLQKRGVTHALKPHSTHFHENDCSGSFDGNSVHSDTEWDAPGF